MCIRDRSKEITHYDINQSKKAAEKLINKKFFFAFFEINRAKRIISPNDAINVLLNSNSDFREKTVDLLFENLKEIYPNNILGDIALKIMQKREAAKGNIYNKAKQIVSAGKTKVANSTK